MATILNLSKTAADALAHRQERCKQELVRFVRAISEAIDAADAIVDDELAHSFEFVDEGSNWSNIPGLADELTHHRYMW